MQAPVHPTHSFHLHKHGQFRYAVYSLRLNVLGGRVTEASLGDNPARAAQIAGPPPPKLLALLRRVFSDYELRIIAHGTPAALPERTVSPNPR